VDSLEHANWFLTALFLIISGVIVGSIIWAQGGRQFFIRRIAGLTAIEEAVGRSTEMGRPIYFSTGINGVNIITLQALTILSHVIRAAAVQGARVIVGTADSVLLTVAEESVREAHASVGREDSFRPEDVRFISDDQFAYALSSVGLMVREQTATHFFFGYFAAEALILTENGRALGALQIAGTPEPVQIPFFIATCDYVVIGDEYYAASAYLTREPTLTGSLVGQDLVKGIWMALILAGIAVLTVLHGLAPAHGPIALFLRWLGVGH
jgi:hypothetical protein